MHHLCDDMKEYVMNKAYHFLVLLIYEETVRTCCS